MDDATDDLAEKYVEDIDVLIDRWMEQGDHAGVPLSRQADAVQHAMMSVAAAVYFKTHIQPCCAEFLEKCRERYEGVTRAILADDGEEPTKEGVQCLKH